MLRSRAMCIAVVVSACGLGPVACDNGSGGVAAAPSASQDFGRAGPPPPLPSHSAPASASAPTAPPQPVRHHVSLAGILLKSAYDLPLTPEQRSALDGAEASLYPPGAPTPWTAVTAFQADLVAGIRANKLDMTKLRADGAEIDRAVAAGQAAEAEALDTLHGVLDAATRQTLADGVKARRDRLERPGPPKPPLGVDGGPVDVTARRLELLSVELSLDDGQKRQVAALLARQAATEGPAVEQARHDAMRRRVDALLTAFPQDSFEAKKLDLSGPTGKLPHERLDEAAAFAAGMMPILKVGQLLMFADQTQHGAGRPERFVEDIEAGPPRPLGAAHP